MGAIVTRATLALSRRVLQSRKSLLLNAATPRYLSLASSRRFTYGVGASYVGKQLTFDKSNFMFQFDPAYRFPQTRDKENRPRSGQDAFFVSRLGDTGIVALGIADGVGGWIDQGVDPADFSHSLCDFMATAAFEYRPGRFPPTARQLLQKGYDAVRGAGTVLAGGSTAAVGLLSPDGSLNAANLGDSGFAILRLNGVHAFSPPQTHHFNAPYQLTILPEASRRRGAFFGEANYMDRPSDADVSHHVLQHGDVVVFASDGLWDNLFKKDILHLVSQIMLDTGAWRKSLDGKVEASEDFAELTQLDDTWAKSDDDKVAEDPDVSSPTACKGDFSLQSIIALAITANARAASEDKKKDGPFAKELRKNFPNEYWKGGKEDDVCVVVALVSEAKGPVRPHL